MKKIFFVLTAGMLVFLSGATCLFAGEIDILVGKLVEKNILTPIEAQIILDETKQEVAKQVTEGKSYALPKWVQNTKLKGDFRLRYQYERRENDTEGRERGRIRYRLGLVSKVTDKVKIGAGLASGGSSARSTNQTLENAFTSGDIRLDYAFAEYAPMNGVKVIGGKFKRKAYLWMPTDMLWDGDINPEGGSIHIEGSLTENIDGFANTGVWILDHEDQVDQADPFLTYVQGGIKWAYDNMDFKLASTYYNFHGLKGHSQLDSNSSSDTNSYVGGGYKYEYDSGHIGVEFGVKELFGGLPLKIDNRIAIFGEYVNAVDPENLNTGWALGMKFGHKKVKKKGSWQGKYIYVNLGKDAWLDCLPDSDRYDPGRTDVKSHEAILQYALNKNIVLGLDYYNSDRIKSSKNRDQVIQADLKFKF